VRERALPRAIPPLRAAAGEEEAAAIQDPTMSASTSESHSDRDREGRRGGQAARERAFARRAHGAPRSQGVKEDLKEALVVTR
jgi:hypothetical protein